MQHRRDCNVVISRQLYVLVFGRADLCTEVSFLYSDGLSVFCSLNYRWNLRYHIEHHQFANCGQYRSVNHTQRRNKETSYYKGDADNQRNIEGSHRLHLLKGFWSGLVPVGEPVELCPLPQPCLNELLQIVHSRHLLHGTLDLQHQFVIVTELDLDV